MQKNKLTFPFTVAVILGLWMISMPAALARFNDVPENHPQARAIENLKLKRVIQGYQDGTFLPEKLVTKAEFLKMVFSDIGFKPEQKPVSTGFEDISNDSWIAPYIKKALELNIIPPPNFNQDKKFGPDLAITKLEALKMAFIVEGISAPYYTDVAPEELFSDISENAPFVYLARAAKKNGIISSKNPDSFTPYKLLTRGDAAELLHQMGLTREGTTIEIININPLVHGITSPDPSTSELVNNPKFQILLDVWEKINATYYEKSKIDKNQLVYGAIKGLVEKLGDQYTVFQEPAEANDFNILLQGQLEGIGASLNMVDVPCGHGNCLTSPSGSSVNKKTVVIKVIPHSPAEKAGIKAGDIIQNVDEKNIENTALKDVIKLIRGPAGSKVTIGILRGNETLKFELTRAKISLLPVSGKMLESNIAYISINEYSIDSSNQFNRILQELLAKTPKGFIIDLRGNPGGYLNAAVDISGHFIEQGEKVTTVKNTDGTSTPYLSNGKGELMKYPVAVLVNAESASASEIMAAAIQDHKAGKIIGNKSYGKGSVQQVINYIDRSLLKITIAHWFTPLDKDINGIGITPDITVNISTQDISANKDPQLEKAVEFVLGK